MIFEEQFPVPRYTAASKIGNSVISLLWQLWCRCNPDHNKFSSSSNTTVVAIFPKLCLWRHSLCSTLRGIGREKLYRATLNDLKPLLSHKKSFTFQKRSMKMLLHWRANLADQNIQQPQKINLRVTYHPWLLSMKQTFNLIDTCQYCSTSRANQSLQSCMFTDECRFSKSRGLSANISFLPLPLPQFPVFGSCSFLTWPENPVPRVFIAPSRNTCYTGYTGD